MTSRTLELYTLFENNFVFTDYELSLIRETSLELNINENIVKDLLYRTLRYAFKELFLDTKDNVTIHFPHLKIVNF